MAAKPLFTAEKSQFARLEDLIKVADHAIVSIPLIDTGALKQILFALDEGQEISAHRAPFPATVQVLEGRMQFGFAGKKQDLTAGDWVVLRPDEMHDVVATKRVKFLLTLVKG